MPDSSWPLGPKIAIFVAQSFFNAALVGSGSCATTRVGDECKLVDYYMRACCLFPCFVFMLWGEGHNPILAVALALALALALAWILKFWDGLP